MKRIVTMLCSPHAGALVCPAYVDKDLVRAMLECYAMCCVLSAACSCVLLCALHMLTKSW